eukprot:5719632-Prymnesium_polylepis.1
MGTLARGPTLSLTLRQGGAQPQAVGVAAASHLEHVVRANAAEGGVDVFVHTWNDGDGPMIDGAYGGALKGSLHQPVEYIDRQKPRSQAQSISRAAGLMKAHEAARGGARYVFALVARIDLVFGAPVRLAAFDPAALWFAEHCCLNGAHRFDGAPPSARAAVVARCGAPPYREGAVNLTTHGQLRKRLLGACRMSQYSGGRPRTEGEDYGYFVMDWWFGAAPDVVAR